MKACWSVESLVSVHRESLQDLLAVPIEALPMLSMMSLRMEKQQANTRRSR